MWSRLPILLTLCAALVTPAAAQAPSAPSDRPHHEAARRLGDPLGRLLDRRAELQLSEDQVKRLEAIRSQYEEKNRPLLEQARKAWAEREPVAPGTGPRARRQQHRDYLSEHPEFASAIRKLHANNQAAWDAAMGILDAPQKDRIKQMRRDWLREHGRVRRSEARG